LFFLASRLPIHIPCQHFDKVIQLT